MKVEVGKHQLPEERYVRDLSKFGNTLWQYRSHVLGGSIILVFAVVGLFMLLFHRMQRSDKAWPAVAEIDSPDDVAYVADLAVGTDAEPFFIMESGTQLFNRGTSTDLKKAEELYRTFATKWRRHPGADYATQSLACVLEQEKRYDEAMDLFASLAQKEGPLASQSLWDAGRCAEKAQKPDVARGFYMRLAVMEDKSSPWTRYAGARLAELLSEKKPKLEVKEDSPMEPDAAVQPEKEVKPETKKEETDG